MITSVTFDDTIPYLVDRRASRFEAADGWQITEEAPGRVRLKWFGPDGKSVPVEVIVQSMPYTLESGPDPVVSREITDEERAGYEMARAGGNSAQLQQQGHGRGRRRP